MFDQYGRAYGSPQGASPVARPLGQKAAATRFANDQKENQRTIRGGGPGAAGAAAAIRNKYNIKAPVQRAEQPEPLPDETNTTSLVSRPKAQYRPSISSPDKRQGTIDTPIDLEDLKNNKDLSDVVNMPEFKETVVRTNLQDWFRQRNNPNSPQRDPMDRGMFASNVVMNMPGGGNV